MKIYKLYNIYIYERYNDLIKSGKTNNTIDNYDLSKIFEWISCIYLYQLYNKPFYEYNDIDPTFKEENQMTKNDTGIDCCDLIDTIVQCKLRKDNLDWKECGTFFGSQNIYSEELNKVIVRWNNLIIVRNEECKLSKNLLEKSKLFTDITLSHKDIINYCENLLIKPPKYYKEPNQKFELRYYQVEAINIIKNNKNNTIISLPTGCGKNIVIIYSLKKNKKYLILVPRIILMEQLLNEIIKHKPEFKNNIQCIGDNNNIFEENKNICICVYNSIYLLEPYFETFNKIYIDEAHHIDKPMIYQNDDDYDELSDEELSDDELDNKLIDNDYNELSDDEIKETSRYHDIIKKLKKYNNNVYLSATIDEIKDFVYYKKDIRDMIEENYLCDYNIHIPIFSDDPSNKNICEHLIKCYRNIIIYCNSQKEGKIINKLMNELQKGCSEYIDCYTSKTKRNNIINKYKEGQIPFLVNVKILVEGFDAPITKGVCFMHLPSSKTILIQIIGRALRLHQLKEIAHIILPFSNKDDESSINNFLKVMANNDRRIKKSYNNKKIGGYISIENIIDDDNLDDDNEDKPNEFEFKYNLIFDNIGNLLNNKDIWEKRLEELKMYIDENNKRPSQVDKDIQIKQLGSWSSTQITNYKKEEQIMKEPEIRKKWNEFINDNKYKKYFINNEDIWSNKLEELKMYIDENNNRPSQKDKNIQIKQLGKWLSTQITSYKKEEHIMKELKIRKKWNEFINDNNYKQYFINNEDIWSNKLEELKMYIDENNKRPSEGDKNIQIKQLGLWLSHQITNYKKEEYIMKELEIRKQWEEFINNDKYKKYFINYEDIWSNKLEELKMYIDENNKKPSTRDKDIKIKQLFKWLSHQITSYKKEEYIMKEPEIRKKWNEFINNDKYKIYFI